MEPNDKIRQIEETLEQKGYDPGEVDGVLDNKTRDAIAIFQKDNNLEVTRFVDNATLEKLEKE